MQGLALAIGDEGAVLVFVGVRQNRLVGVDHREAARLNVLLLAERQQAVEELLVDLQHLDEFHEAAVGDVQLAVEAVGARVALDADLADGREVNRAGQFGDVLRLGVTRREGADADALLLGKDDAVNEHVLVAPAVDMLQVVAALRAELALDVDAIVLGDFRAQFERDQVQRLLMHRAVFDGEDGAILGARPAFQSALEHGHDGRLAAADRPHQ